MFPSRNWRQYFPYETSVNFLHEFWNKFIECLLIFRLDYFVFLSPVQKLKGSKCSVGYEVLTAVVMKSSVLWDMTPYSLLKVNRRFGRRCRAHFQGHKISEARYQHKAVSRARLMKFVCAPMLNTVTNISPSHKSLKEQGTEETY
jgi:hypothetical protein